MGPTLGWVPIIALRDTVSVFWVELYSGQKFRKPKNWQKSLKIAKNDRIFSVKYGIRSNLYGIQAKIDQFRWIFVVFQ